MTTAPISQDVLKNVMLDAFCIRLSGAIHYDEGVSFSSLLQNLQEHDGVKVQPDANRRRLQIELPLDDEEEGKHLGEAKLDLYFQQESFLDRRIGERPVRRITSRSTMTVNPQKLLRQELGDEACGHVGLDGNTNVLGLHSNMPELLERAINLLQESLEVCLSLFDRLLPAGAKWVWDEFAIRSGEVCLDIPVPDAMKVTRRLQHAAFSEATTVVSSGYRPRAQNGGPYISLRWVKAKEQPEFKAYPKRRDLLRLEYACRTRTAVNHVVRGAKSAKTPATLKYHIREFVRHASVKLEKLYKHVQASLENQSDVAALVMGLAPLTNLANGQRPARGPAPTDESRQWAQDALGELLQAGIFNARHIPIGTSAYRVLRQLTDDDNVLVRKRGKNVYTVNPKYAEAVERLCRLSNDKAKKIK